MSKKVTLVVDATNPNLQDTETPFFDNSQSIDFGEVEEFVQGIDGQLYVKKGESLVAVRVMNEVEYGTISQQKDTIGIPVGSGAASGQESFASGDEEDHEEDMVEGDNVSTNESVTESSVEVTDELKLLLQKIIKKTFKHHLVGK